MTGYLRRIVLTAPASGRVEAALEDDFHRFEVTLRHNGEEVTECTGRAVRYPWTECPGAVDALAALAGVPLLSRGTSIGDFVDPHANCTHLFDLAGLAVAHAAAGREGREYLAAVPDRDAQWRTRAELRRDGEVVLGWDVEGIEIRGPAPYDGVRLRGGFLRWADQHLDAETAEAATVLRRACEISMGRHTPWDELETAAEVGDFMLGVCHTFQPGRAEVALRVKGSVQDFSDRPEALLRES